MRTLALLVLLTASGAPAWAALSAEQAAVARAMDLDVEDINRNITAAQQKELDDAFAKADGDAGKRDVMNRLITRFAAKWLGLAKTLLG